MFYTDSGSIISALDCAAHVTSPLPLERLWCFLCVWHLKYKPVWPWGGAQRGTFNKLCSIYVSLSTWMFSTIVFWIIAQQNGPLPHAAMSCLSKTIWVTPREKDNRGCSETHPEPWCKVYRDLWGERLREGFRNSNKSQRMKKCREWTWAVLPHFKAIGEVREETHSQDNFRLWEQEKIRHSGKEKNSWRECLK